jgi:hypothetical protein
MKFFRTIRKKLIGQDNIRAYVFHVAGDIPLVSNGILVAFQVNSRNRQRLSNTCEPILMIRFLTGLHADRINLGEVPVLRIERRKAGIKGIPQIDIRK